MAAFEAVHAEIEVSTASDLPADLSRSLASRFPGGGSAESAVAETILHGDPQILSSLVYGRITHDLVYLVFVENRRSLRVHLQRRPYRSTLTDVKRSAEDLAEQFAEFLRYHDKVRRHTKIWIFAGRSHLQTGTLRSRGERVRQALSSELLPTISLAFTAIIVSFAFREDVKQAMLDGLIAALALLFRSLIEAAAQKMEYEYV